MNEQVAQTGKEKKKQSGQNTIPSIYPNRIHQPRTKKKTKNENESEVKRGDLKRAESEGFC